ncbi:DUF6049 family protein [Nocardioides zeicaulis]|uniref:DUF6049 family protein n=1 Tax=Nocardioides zeicaulis TaxID=1776857 RepID=A0ABV6E1T2_9ACTN
MPRPSDVRAALGALTARGAPVGVVVAVLLPVLLAVVLGGAAGAAAAPADEADPLVVHIDSIDPVLPRSGKVRITGTVTNTSDVTFTRVNTHAFASQSPILAPLLLANSASTVPPSAYVGERVTVPGTFDTIDSLAPGETQRFSDSIPRSLLGVPDEAGVYWIGVHAIGDGAVPRDTVADGRARTFIPVLPPGERTQELSLVLPLRMRVWYDEDGRIGGVDRWVRRLADGGSLDGVLDTAEAAGSTPYTWLVDPAVLQAVRRLAVGNPPRSLVPDQRVPGQEPTETPSGTPSTDSPAPVAPVEADDDEQLDPEIQAAATDWLARFATLVGTDEVLTLPFGDLDVDAAVRNGSGRFAEAQARSAEVMGELGLAARPAVAPESGRMSPDAIAATPEGTVLMLADTAFAIPPSSSSSTVRLLGHKVVVTSTGAESGGPAPTAATDPLAVRQRVISEAALRALAPDAPALVMNLPSTWRDTDAAKFFDQLDQPWLSPVLVTSLEARPARSVDASTLVYGEDETDAELPASAFVAADRTTETAALLEEVLTLQTTIEAQVRDETLVTLSEHHRQRPRPARLAADRVTEALRDDLGSITIEAPPGVTLSSDSGPLGATLVNGLDQPVTVGIGVSSDGSLTLTGDSVRTLGPRARSVVRFKASATEAGIHRVRLRVTSAEGVALGASDEVPIRAARVSALIWGVMAAGALVLFGMIGYRLPAQVRARRAELRAAESEPEDEPVSDPEPEAP